MVLVVVFLVVLMFDLTERSSLFGWSNSWLGLYGIINWDLLLRSSTCLFLRSFLAFLLDNCSGFFLDWVLGLSSCILSLLGFIGGDLIGLAGSTNSLAVKTSVFVGWNGTGISDTGISLSCSCWSCKLLSELLIPPVSLLDSVNECWFWWTNWCVVVGIRALNSNWVSAINVITGIIWTGSVWIEVISILLILTPLSEIMRVNLNIIIDSLVLVLCALLEPVFSLLIGPCLVVIHSIIRAHSSRIGIVFVATTVMLVSVMVLFLECINIKEDVGVETDVVLGVVHSFLLQLDGANVAEQCHHCQ